MQVGFQGTRTNAASVYTSVSNIHQKNLEFEKLEFENSDFENSEFEHLEFENSEFKNSDFENSEFENSEFENSELKNEKWKGYFLGCGPVKKTFWDLPMKTINFGFGSTALTFCFKFGYILGPFCIFLGHLG